MIAEPAERRDSLNTVENSALVPVNQEVRLITQVVRPGFKFQLFFFPRSVTNRHLVSKAHALPVRAYST